MVVRGVYDIERRSVPVVAGHPFVPMGHGEDARGILRAILATGREVRGFDIYGSGRADHGIGGDIEAVVGGDLSETLNIFVINGDEVEPVIQRVGLPSTAYNVVFPQWELEGYPREWAEKLDLFDEVWAPSRFVAGALKAVVHKQVLHMPLSVNVGIKECLGRRYFGLPESSYTFLFAFDTRSYVDRKNPFAVMRAFQAVCKRRPALDVRLVVKVSGGRDGGASTQGLHRFWESLEQLGVRDRVVIIDRGLTENEMKNLIHSCDCFVSLHRSEGYGLALAEAMFLGKAVIATAYSGNRDFMSDQNACLVPYKLVPVPERAYPRWQGQVWAEADTECAEEYMTRLAENPEEGRAIGAAASRHIRTYFSHRPAGLRYVQRIDEIGSAR